MENEEVQKLFCTKISLELGQFKQRILKQEPENIYHDAFRIDCMINIYETLLEISQKTENETLKKLLVIPGLLAFFYDKWLKQEDSYMDELTDCIEKCLLEVRE